MQKNSIRENLRNHGSNPAGDLMTEINEGIGGVTDSKDESALTITISVGCSTFLTILCC